MNLKKIFNNSATKLSRSDFLTIITLSALVSILTFYITFIFDIYVLEQVNPIIHAILAILTFPAIISGYILDFLNATSDPYGYGSAFLVMSLLPFINFVIYYSIFLGISILTSKIIRSKKFLMKHSLSICIVVATCFPFIYYSWGSVEMNACLSGKLNYTYHSTNGNLDNGPSDCFERITERKSLDSSDSIKYCEKLSGTHKVAEPNPFNKDLPSLSYRNYCSYKLEVYPPEELCEKISEGNQFQQKICSGQFIWKNRPVSSDTISTIPVTYMPIESSGRANYSLENGVTLKRSTNENKYTWIAGEISVPQGLNVIEFDANFLNSIPPEALVGIYIDSDKIRTLDGRMFSEGKYHLKFDFPAYRAGKHVLGFRLDTFAPGETQITFTNIRFGFKDYPGVFDTPHSSETGY